MKRQAYYILDPITDEKQEGDEFFSHGSWHPAEPGYSFYLSLTYRRRVADEKPQPKENEWIPWNGGECPVHAMTAVAVKLRQGLTHENVSAHYLRWTNRGDEDDIIAYRVVNPHPTNPVVEQKETEVSDKSPTPSRYQWTYKSVSFDYYRLCQILGLSNDAQKHALKKIIRAGQSVKSVTQDIDEAIDCLERWKQMIVEDGKEGYD